MEEKLIPNYPTYMITNTGLVRDLRSGTLFNGHCANGYRKINLLNYNGYKCFLIHRLVAQAFIENPNNYAEVDHINRRPEDNRVENLRWADDFIQANNRSPCKTPSNNKLGHKNINMEDGYFRVVIVRNKKRLTRKRFQTLDEAIKYRDEVYKTLED